MLFCRQLREQLLRKCQRDAFCSAAARQVAVIVASAVAQTLPVRRECHSGYDDKVEKFRRYDGQVLMRCRYAVSSGGGICPGVAYVVELHFVPRQAARNGISVPGILLQQGQQIDLMLHGDVDADMQRCLTLQERDKHEP